MRRRCVYFLLSVILLGCSVYFHVVAGQAAKNAANVWRNVTIVLETPLSAEDAQSLSAREYDTAFAVWGELAGETVSDPDLGRRTKADLIAFYGLPELIFPLSGGMAEGGGVLIGEQTAWELFGSTAVAGDTVCIGGETYPVLAVFSMPQSGVVVSGESLPDETAERLRFDRLTAACAQAADGEVFLQQTGLAGSVLRFDCMLGYRWLAELVPGKWSDFSGWRENMEKTRQDLALLSKVSKNSVELCYQEQCRRYRQNIRPGVCCAVLAVFAAFRCASRRRRYL